jgi:hypothetical protein
MFGTDRAIKKFQLDIHPVADPAQQEGCTAWGSVSHTSEIDFMKVAIDDCIVFSLFVTPETFARYTVKVAHGFSDEMIFSVRGVDGFYSAWDPFGSSTRNVKVLTGDSEKHKVTFAPGHYREPLRLGCVRGANLDVKQRVEFGKPAPEREAADEMADIGTERAVQATQVPTAVGPGLLQMLRSLRRAAWFVVCLLAVIFIVMLLRR